MAKMYAVELKTLGGKWKFIGYYEKWIDAVQLKERFRNAMRWARRKF